MSDLFFFPEKRCSKAEISFGKTIIIIRELGERGLTVGPHKVVFDSSQSPRVCTESATL